MFRTILPANATDLELALEETMTRAFDLPVDIAKLLRPEECPIQLLPWLAWQLSVDEWDTRWDEATKRAVVEASVYIHRHKGTKAAVNRALQIAGAEDAQLLEWFEPGGSGIPRTFWLTLPLEHLAVSTLLGQETLLKLVEAAKPVAAHPKMILQLNAEVIASPGHFVLPSNVHINDLRPLVVRREFFGELANFKVLVAGENRQHQVPAIPFQLPSDSTQLILTLNNLSLSPPVQDGHLIIDVPVGEAQNGALFVRKALDIPSQVLSGGIQHQNAATTAQQIGYDNQVVMLFSNCNDNKALITSAQVLTRPLLEGEIEHGTMLVRFPIQRTISEKIAGFLEQKQARATLELAKLQAIVGLLTNTDQRVQASSSVKVMHESPKLDGEIINGAVFSRFIGILPNTLTWAGYGKALLSKRATRIVSKSTCKVVVSNTHVKERTASMVLHPSPVHAVIQDGQAFITQQIQRVEQIFSGARRTVYLQPSQQIDLTGGGQALLGGWALQLVLSHGLQLPLISRVSALLTNHPAPRMIQPATQAIQRVGIEGEILPGQVNQYAAICESPTMSYAGWAYSAGTRIPLFQQLERTSQAVATAQMYQQRIDEKRQFSLDTSTTATTARIISIPLERIRRDFQLFAPNQAVAVLPTNVPTLSKIDVTRWIHQSLGEVTTPGQVVVDLNVTDAAYCSQAGFLHQTAEENQRFVVDHQWLQRMVVTNTPRPTAKTSAAMVIHPQLPTADSEAGQLNVTATMTEFKHVQQCDFYQQSDAKSGLQLHPTMKAKCVVLMYQG